jgi:hypothetical protein
MIPGYVLQIVVMVACGWASGKYGSRMYWVMGQMVGMLFCQLVLAVWPVSEGFKWFAYFGLWCSNAVGVSRASLVCSRRSLEDGADTWFFLCSQS